ncbi:hypothetical protein HY373_01085 [Candidatus Berkelbacteria bacterium]|nr:hypothetical protein [Candidatus Berkelbacteria bacterium]MBI2588439.1 hypothetical protein [Candidatus Berkelbacteria bacterium]MBI4029754.1 hypothetical protein [Candidatus Berkelbacteria bacterium]
MNEKQMTLDDLAAMVVRGFREQREYMDKRFEQIDERFKQIDKRFERVDERFKQADARFLTINARLDLIETDISNLNNLYNNLYQEVKEIHKLLDEVIFRQEFDVWKKRLLRVERHLGFVK